MENKSKNFRRPYIKIYHKVNIIKTVWYFCKDKQNRLKKENKNFTSFMIKNKSTVVPVSFPNGKHEFWPWIFTPCTTIPKLILDSNENTINKVSKRKH